MSEIGAGTGGRFDVARVVSRVFRVLGANLAVFVGLAVLLELPDLAFDYGAVFFTKHALATGNYATVVLLMGATRTFVSFLCRNLLTAALIHGTIMALNGRRASFGQCLFDRIEKPVSAPRADPAFGARRGGRVPAVRGAGHHPGADVVRHHTSSMSSSIRLS